MDLKKETEELIKSYKEEIRAAQSANDKNVCPILLRDLSNLLQFLSSIKLAED